MKINTFFHYAPRFEKWIYLGLGLWVATGFAFMFISFYAAAR